MKVVILAGGLGTRLGEETARIPKPMVEIGGKSILEHQITLAREYGLKDIIIISGHLSHVITDYFEDGRDFGVNITHICEPYPLGTAGCMKMIENIVHDRFLVFYGDLFLNFDIHKFIEFDQKSGFTPATIMVQPNDYPYDSDLLEINHRQEVAAFHPKPRGENEYHRNLVNAAVYILSPEIFRHIEPDKFQDFGKDIFPELLRKKVKIKAYKTSEYLKDLGTPDRFEEVNEDFISGKIAEANNKRKRKAVFFELAKDTEILFVNYPHTESNFIIENLREFVRKVNKSGYLAVMTKKSRCSGINPHLQKKIETILGRKNAYLDEILHLKTGSDSEIEKAAQELNIDPDKSCFIKDTGKERNDNYENAFQN